jgi:hypothetical protein
MVPGGRTNREEKRKERKYIGYGSFTRTCVFGTPPARKYLRLEAFEAGVQTKEFCGRGQQPRG